MKCPSEFQRAEKYIVLKTRSATTPAHAEASDTTEFRPESLSPMQHASLLLLLDKQLVSIRFNP